MVRLSDILGLCSYIQLLLIRILIKIMFHNIVTTPFHRYQLFDSKAIIVVHILNTNGSSEITFVQNKELFWTSIYVEY